MTPDWAARPTTVPYAAFGDPQSLNLYGYVRNDPVSRVDADGHLYSPGAEMDSAFEAYFGPPASTSGKTTGQRKAQEKQVQSNKTSKSWWAALTGSVAVGMARISPAAARKLWEAANPGQKVPFDAARGRFQDMAHILARTDGGKDVAENLKPQEHGEHMAEHMAKGDFARWASRARDAVEGGAKEMGEEIKSGAHDTASAVSEAATEVVESPGEAAKDAATALVEAAESGEIPLL